MNYKGYEAIVEYDDRDKLFVGRVINTVDIIGFDGTTVEELEQSFHSVIEEYLEDCKTIGKTPDKPFSGKFNLRLSPSLHRQAFEKAKKEGVSLNSFVENAINNACLSKN